MPTYMQLVININGAGWEGNPEKVEAIRDHIRRYLINEDRKGFGASMMDALWESIPSELRPPVGTAVTVREYWPGPNPMIRGLEDLAKCEKWGCGAYVGHCNHTRGEGAVG